MKSIALLPLIAASYLFAEPMIPFEGQTAQVEIPLKDEALTLRHMHLEGNITYRSGGVNTVTVTLSDYDADEELEFMRAYLNYNEENHVLEIQLPPDVLSDTDIIIEGPSQVNLKLQNTDGDIEISDTSGEHEIHSIDGNIILSNVTGGLYIASVDGDISLISRNLESLTAIHCNTVDGDLNLELPADINADIQANTIDGDIIIEMPNNNLKMPRSPVGSSVQGTLGDGGIMIQLNTVDGEITLKPVENNGVL